MSGDPHHPLLGPTQRSVVGFTITLVSLLASVAALVAAFAVLGRLASFFSGVLWPLAVAGVLAVVLRPLVSIFEQRLRIRRVVAVVLLFSLFLIALATVLQWLVPLLVSQLLDLVAYLPTFWQDAQSAAERFSPRLVEFAQALMQYPAVQRIVEQLSSEVSTMLSTVAPSLRAAGGGLLGFFGFVTHAAVIPVYLFFFLLSRHDPFRNLGSNLAFLQERFRDDVVFLVREFAAIVESFFRGQLIIALVMGVLMAIGFTLVGLRFGVFVGLMLGILNIVPYLGTIIGVAVTLPLAYFQVDGGWQLLGFVILVMIAVQSIEGWILTPTIMGDRTGLHPVTIIVAIFFWGTAFGGILGMVLAIPLTAFFVTAWRLVLRKYFSETPAPSG
jgi:predicted PurR-regulated permease PerM